MSSNSSNASARRRRAGAQPNRIDSAGPTTSQVPMTPVSLLQQHNFRLSQLERTIDQLMKTKEEDTESLQEEVVETKTSQRHTQSNNFRYKANDLEDVRTQNNVFERMKRNQTLVPNPPSPQNESVDMVEQSVKSEISSSQLIELNKKIEQCLNAEKFNTFEEKFNTFEQTLPSKIEQMMNGKLKEIDLNSIKSEVQNIKKNAGDSSKKIVEELNADIRKKMDEMILELAKVKDMFQSQHKLVNSQQETINKLHTMLIDFVEKKENEERKAISQSEAHALEEVRNQKMAEMMEMLTNRKKGNENNENK